MILSLLIALLISFGYVDAEDSFYNLSAEEQHHLEAIIEDDLEAI